MNPSTKQQHVSNKTHPSHIKHKHHHHIHPLTRLALLEILVGIHLRPVLGHQAVLGPLGARRVVLGAGDLSHLEGGREGGREREKRGELATHSKMSTD